jgi:hypothetical protein
MSIKHTIRNERGKQVEVNLTPIKAIRTFCMECMMWKQAEIPRCTAPLCPLFPFRMGEAHKDVSPEQRKRLSESAIERAKNKRCLPKSVQGEAI